MNSRQKAQKFALLLLTPVLVVSFTNCAPSFEAGTLSSSSSESQSGVDDSNPEPSSTPDPVATATPEPQPSPTPMPGATATPRPTATPVPPVVTTPTPVPAGKRGVFMAVGHMGRTTISCDNGNTWIRDRSENDAARCWVSGSPNYVECDHTAFSATPGAADFADGTFFASFGWGANGVVRRTTEGSNWQVVKSNDWGGGTLAVPGSVFNMRSVWAYSTNRGDTWQNSTLNGFDAYTLDHPMPFRVGTTMFAAGRETNRNDDIAYSTDGGRTWNLGQGFHGQNQSMVGGNGVIIASGYTGNNAVTVERSTDNGRTWNRVTVPGATAWTTNVIFNGAYFVLWTGDRKFMSMDGLNWTSVAANRAWYEATVAVDPLTNSYVAISKSFGNDYANQFAYRSTDGNTWTRLSTSAFRGGHPINQIIRGEMNTSDCP